MMSTERKSMIKYENAKNHDKISKYLSYILRHKPESINLILDNYGWANIDELIDKTNEFSLTRKMIDEVVTSNDKQRFTIKKDHIRANQGHSIAVDLELKVKKPNDVLYHGTATRFLDSILKLGILPQNREHVHLSHDKEIATTVAKRHGKPIILVIDALKMHQDNYKFFLSSNNVWLTDYIPLKYLREQGSKNA